MSFQLDWHGDEIIDKYTKAIEGNPTLSELLSDSFMQQNTDFKTFQEMFDAGGIKSADDIKSEAFSTFIASKTRFANWTDMLHAAVVERAKRRLTK